MKKHIRSVLALLLIAVLVLSACGKAPEKKETETPAAPAETKPAELPAETEPADIPAETEPEDVPAETEPADVPAEPEPSDVPVSDYTYEKTDAGIVLTAYTGNEAEPEIPAEIGGTPVVEIGDGCFQGLLCLRKLHIPEGITRIGDYAFECCAALQKVYFPDSLREIGEGAFSGCVAMTLADLQNNVETIGRGAFLYCTGLVQLELAESLQSVGEFAFAECNHLTTVNFNGTNLTAVPDRMFFNCASLLRLNIPAGVKTIGKRAFSGCESLRNMYIADPPESVGEYAFENCRALTNVNFAAPAVASHTFSGCNGMDYIGLDEGVEKICFGAFTYTSASELGMPSTVSELEEGAFYSTAFRSVRADECGNFITVDGSLYTADGKELIAYFPEDPYSEEEPSEFTVPEGVEVIWGYAFSDTALTTVNLPSTLKEIRANAFFECGVTDLAVPEGVTVSPEAFGPEQPEDAGGGYEEEAGPEPERETGSWAPDKSLFRAEDYEGYIEITNDMFDDWCVRYLEHVRETGPMDMSLIPYTILYKGEAITHFVGMTAVQNHDPNMWAEAAGCFGDDFESMYLMMNHGLFTELRRGTMCDDLILYSGLYDSQVMAAAGTDVLPTREQLIDSIGNTFTDPVMISTTTDTGIAAHFGDTLFVIYASKEAMEALGAICIDAVANSPEKEILMTANAQYRVLDVGTMSIDVEDWDGSVETLYRDYIAVELLGPGE